MITSNSIMHKKIVFCDQNILSFFTNYSKLEETTTNSNNDVLNEIKKRDKRNVIFSFVFTLTECNKKTFPTIKDRNLYILDNFKKIYLASKKLLNYAETDIRKLENAFKESSKNYNENAYVNLLEALDKIELYQEFLKNVVPQLVNEVKDELTYEKSKNIVKKAVQFNIRPAHPIVIICILILCKYDKNLTKHDAKIRNIIKPKKNYNNSDAYNAINDIYFAFFPMIFCNYIQLWDKVNTYEYECLTQDKSLQKFCNVIKDLYEIVYTRLTLSGIKLYLDKKFFPSLSDDQYNDLIKLINSLFNFQKNYLNIPIRNLLNLTSRKKFLLFTTNLIQHFIIY